MRILLVEDDHRSREFLAFGIAPDTIVLNHLESRRLLMSTPVAREEQWQAAMADAGPELAFDRRWAEEIMRRAVTRVDGDCPRAGNYALYQALRPALFGEKLESLEALAQRFGMTAGGAGAAVFRMRAKFRTILRDEVSQTVAEPQELDGEIQYLLTLLAR